MTLAVPRVATELTVAADGVVRSMFHSRQENVKEEHMTVNYV